MKKTKSFSILEVMVVILIILILISLTLPVFTKVKMQARSTICKSQLRQIGTMFTLYASDNKGYLPNDNKTDGNITGSPNNNLYSNWNGHLLPYINSGIKSYERSSKLRKDGNVYAFDHKKYKGTIKPDDPLLGGWVVIHDACYNGGYDTLKAFICPEIFANTYDVGVSNSFNGLRIPRISEMAPYAGFEEMTWTYIGGGVPTTYLANETFFGFDDPWRPVANSLRIDEISAISNKAFLIEGGVGWASGGGTNGSGSYVYYSTYHGDLGTSLNADLFNKINTGCHKTNFVHDDNKEFWLTNNNTYGFPNTWMPESAKTEIVLKFNNTFAGKAMMVSSLYGYSIVSFIDPDNGKIFEDFFLANPPKAKLPSFVLFDEPEFHYMTGSMNVLFGDTSVLTKDQGWLTLNRAKLSQLTKE